MARDPRFFVSVFYLDLDHLDAPAASYAVVRVPHATIAQLAVLEQALREAGVRVQESVYDDCHRDVLFGVDGELNFVDSPEMKLALATAQQLGMDARPGATTEELYRRHRTWGYFEDFATAEAAVLENWTDMYENGYYNLALIEEIPPGICVRTEETWYRVDPVYNPDYQEREVDGTAAADGDVKLTLLAYGTGPVDGPMQQEGDFPISGYKVSRIQKPRRLSSIVHFSFGS